MFKSESCTAALIPPRLVLGWWPALRSLLLVLDLEMDALAVNDVLHQIQAILPFLELVLGVLEIAVDTHVWPLVLNEELVQLLNGEARWTVALRGLLHLVLVHASSQVVPMGVVAFEAQLSVFLLLNRLKVFMPVVTSLMLNPWALELTVVATLPGPDGGTLRRRLMVYKVASGRRRRSCTTGSAERIVMLQLELEVGFVG